MDLELEPHSELRVPWRVQCALHLSELSAAHDCIRQAESRSVGEIEELSSNLELHALSDGYFLAQRKVGVMNAVAPQIGKISWRISSYLVSGGRET